MHNNCTHRLPTSKSFEENDTLGRNVSAVFGAFVLVDETNGAPRQLDLDQIGAIVGSVKATGLLDAAYASQVELHVVVSCGVWGKEVEGTDCTLASRAVASHVQGLPNVVVHTYKGNAYEYPATHFLWQLACASPDRVFLYFHNKGVKYSLRTRHPSRIADEMLMFNEVVAPWRYYVRLFSDPATASDAAGFAASLANFFWHNFHWMQGSFISRLAEPYQAPSRWYYEKRWMRNVPSNKEESACGTGPPVVGQAVNKGVNTTFVSEGLKGIRFFSSLFCNTSKKIDRSFNPEYFFPRRDEFAEDIRRYNDSIPADAPGQTALPAAGRLAGYTGDADDLSSPARVRPSPLRDAYNKRSQLPERRHRHTNQRRRRQSGVGAAK